MARGQATVEFILIVVIMLTILATISIPMINEVTDWVADMGVAVSMGSSAQRVVSTAEEVALMGCGSYKKVRVAVDDNPLAAANLRWGKDAVWGNYSDQDGTPHELRQLDYPSFVRLDGGCDQYVGGASREYVVTVSKDCSAQRPTAGETSVGEVCYA
ncbi:MAG: hypothetical protein JW834_02225 [Candidatus Diapherotrites archaeon]|nr:hypothetical protein [Candidatus Diapherotrites archaeon]